MDRSREDSQFFFLFFLKTPLINDNGQLFLKIKIWKIRINIKGKKNGDGQFFYWSILFCFTNVFSSSLQSHVAVLSSKSHSRPLRLRGRPLEVAWPSSLKSRMTVLSSKSRGRPLFQVAWSPSLWSSGNGEITLRQKWGSQVVHCRIFCFRDFVVFYFFEVFQLLHRRL